MQKKVGKSLSNLEKIATNKKMWKSPQDLVFAFLNGVAPEENENQQKLTSFSLLQYGWDGKDGLEFSKKNISFFRNVISSLKIQPELAPTNKGGIYIRYHTPDNTILYFELYRSVMVQTLIPAGDYESMSSKSYSENFSEIINTELFKLIGKEFPEQKDSFKKKQKNKKS